MRYTRHTILLLAMGRALTACNEVPDAGTLLQATPDGPVFAKPVAGPKSIWKLRAP